MHLWRMANTAKKWAFVVQATEKLLPWFDLTYLEWYTHTTELFHVGLGRAEKSPCGETSENTSALTQMSAMHPPKLWHDSPISLAEISERVTAELTQGLLLSRCHLQTQHLPMCGRILSIHYMSHDKNVTLSVCLIFQLSLREFLDKSENTSSVLGASRLVNVKAKMCSNK